MKGGCEVIWGGVHASVVLCLAAVAPNVLRSSIRHSGENRSPEEADNWIPAYAGMTVVGGNWLCPVLVCPFNSKCRIMRLGQP